MLVEQQQIRLNKFLAENLGLSRQEADEAIARGKVKLGEKTAKIGDRITLVFDKNGGHTIDKYNKVCYNGKIVVPKQHFTYLALNKPVGYVSSRKRQGEVPTLYELLPEKYQKLKTVGRLDKDSCGLILLTDDGDFGFEMTHPKFVKQKRYIVVLERPLAPLHQQMISDFGVTLKDGKSRMGLERVEIGEIDSEEIEEMIGGEPLKAGGVYKKTRRKRTDKAKIAEEAEQEKLARRVWRVELTEGRNRQIRRTFGALGYTVIGLKRVRFGVYELRELSAGDFEEIKK